MSRWLLSAMIAALIAPAARASQDPPAAEAPVSFLKDVAPILVERCVGCHNSRKAESKYDLTSFGKLSAGGAQGEGIMFEGNDVDASYFVELLRPDGAPRMPYKQDPMPEAELHLIERWVKEGAKYDGREPAENWVAVLNRTRVIPIPEAYPAPMPITAVTFTPDGQSLLASGYHELNRFNRADGAVQSRTTGLAERIYDVSYSPDGKWLATASGTPGQVGSARLWKVKDDGSFELARELSQADDSVFAAAFRPDGAQVAFAGADRAIRVFNVETGEQVGLIEDHADWIFDLAYSPDGKRLASASRDKTSKVFDAEKFESIVTFPGHNDIVYTVGFSGDGKLVATGGQDARIRVWNPDEEAKQTLEIAGFGGPVFQLRYFADGARIAACSGDKSVRLFKAADGAAEQTMQGHNDWVYSIAVAPDGQSLASGSWDGEIRLWSTADGKPISTILAAPGYKPPTPPPATP